VSYDAAALIVYFRTPLSALINRWTKQNKVRSPISGFAPIPSICTACCMACIPLDYFIAIVCKPAFGALAGVTCPESSNDDIIAH